MPWTLVFGEICGTFLIFTSYRPVKLVANDISMLLATVTKTHYALCSQR